MLAQFDDFREVAAAPEGVEPGAADEPIRVALEVAPFVVIGEARGVIRARVDNIRSASMSASPSGRSIAWTS